MSDGPSGPRHFYREGPDPALYGDDGDEDPGVWTAVPPGGTGDRAAPRRADRSARRHHPVLTALVIVVVLVLVAVAGGLVWAHDQIDPGRPGRDVSVDVAHGATTSEIASELAAAGVIHEATLFELYARVHGNGPLLSGVYSLPQNSSYGSVISALEAGPKTLTDTLTIPPGYTVAQIAAAVAALPGLGLSAHKLISDADTGVVRSPYEPAGVDNLEGLLFPDTYYVAQGETEADILEKLVDEFDSQVAPLGLTSAAARLGYTPYQVIEVASIVEREAKLDKDRPDVASTIYNRLRIGMTLGADSTQTYYLRLNDPTLQPTVAQLEQPSPYNTRLNTGLPPTPIATPGLPSLEAAIDPPATDDLYFVEINPEGQLGFATNASGFAQLQQECQAAGLC